MCGRDDDEDACPPRGQCAAATLTPTTLRRPSIGKTGAPLGTSCASPPRGQETAAGEARPSPSHQQQQSTKVEPPPPPLRFHVEASPIKRCPGRALASPRWTLLRRVKVVKRCWESHPAGAWATGSMGTHSMLLHLLAVLLSLPPTFRLYFSSV